MILAGGLGGGNDGFVGDLGRVIFDRIVFGHDSLGDFGVSQVGKLTEISIIGKDVTSANVSGDATSVDADSVKTEAVGRSGRPGGGNGFGTDTGVASGVANGGTGS